MPGYGGALWGKYSLCYKKLQSWVIIILAYSQCSCFLQALYQNDNFTKEEMHNYRMAVTEREVRNRCITMPDDDVKGHVVIYTRILRIGEEVIQVMFTF
jgi:hypothetical protein